MQYERKISALLDELQEVKASNDPYYAAENQMTFGNEARSGTKRRPQLPVFKSTLVVDKTEKKI